MGCRPTAEWDTLRYEDSLWTVVKADVSLMEDRANMEWMVVNIPGNDISRGDELMEYIISLTWRNCVNGVDNHGAPCEGDGMIYDPDYTHQNPFWVFRQTRGKLTPAPGMRQSGCQVNI